MKTHSTKTLAVTATVAILGLLAQSRGAYSQAAEQVGRARFEPASLEVPAGNDCLLHPKGNRDSSQSIAVRSDADGVARFLAVRATLPNSVRDLALDCTDAYGNASSFLVDLRSAETFAPRPFDASRANLGFRPGLAVDPLSSTQEQLVEAGYGLRPDPTGDPDGYKAWLDAVSAPAYKLKAAPRPSAAHANSHPIPRPAVLVPAVQVSADSVSADPGNGLADHFEGVRPEGVKPEAVFLSPSNYWTGAMLTGSYKLGTTSAKTYGYVENQAHFIVPTITPDIFSTKNTALTIWNGLDNVFQAIVDVGATPTVGSYLIHRQNFYHDLPKGIDEQGVDFTPNAGDEVFVQEWYCDSKGHVKMAGGYGCSIMIDKTQNIEWECDQASSSDCQSYPIESKFLVNGALGQTAEYIIEDDTAEVTGNCPKATKTTNCYDELTDISPVTMTGSALVVEGSSSTGKTVTTSTDPNVLLLTDNTASIPYNFGDGHFLITLPTGATKWSEGTTNVYYWNGTNFDNLTTPQTSGTARPGVIDSCASWLAVGPNSRGLTNGTPWSTGCHAAADGNYDIYEMQTGGAWVRMQSDIATEVATSSDGHIWAINKKGDIFYWNGSKFVANPTGGCATMIAAGPDSRGLTHGTPWITGCHADSDKNYDIYQMQTDGKWVKMQSDIATRLAVSPEGIPWAVNSKGEILYWNGSKFVVNAAGGCAINIGVGPNSSGESNGTPWIVGCTPQGVPFGDYSVYEMQSGKWVKMQSYAGLGIAVSPEGNAWTITWPKPL